MVAHLQFAQTNAKPKIEKEPPKLTHGKEIAAKMKDRITIDKNGQLVTGGIFYCRDSADFSVSASNKLSCNLTSLCSEIGNKNIPPIRYITSLFARNKALEVLPHTFRTHQTQYLLHSLF